MIGNSDKRWSYGSEDGCDVTFIVGQNEPWRLPAHSAVLRKENHVFKTMLSETYVPAFPHIETVTVPDVDGRAFDNLLRCLYKERICPQSVENALATLYAAHKYRCLKLVQICVKYLLDKRNDSNVLGILLAAQFLSAGHREFKTFKSDEDKPKKQAQTPQGNEDLHMPSAPPIWKINAPDDYAMVIESEATVSDIEAQCCKLQEDCLSFVDRNAIGILASEELEDLDLATLRLILLRDTLEVPNEIVVFDALLKWADKECKRRQLPLTAASKRQVLEDSLYLPRYLAMSLSSFQHGPVKSDLFNPMEIRILTTLIKINTGSKVWTVSLSEFPSIRPFLHEGPRCPRPDRRPVHDKNVDSKRKGFRFFKRLKSGNRFCCRKKEITTPANSTYSSPTHRSNPRRESQSGRFSRFNFVESIFICLACLFD